MADAPRVDPQRETRSKAEREAYRTAARRLVGTLAHVGTQAHVQLTEEGAYVEAHIWVPKTEIA